MEETTTVAAFKRKSSKVKVKVYNGSHQRALMKGLGLQGIQGWPTARDSG
jgi:hypothetical protein